ncbi:MAG TPA: NAD(P)H-hydrate dehydratase [Thermoanaerobaculia bacterium]|nr:NAD(P)H-hydrate dehydratase [Thermoanaerobaculia bacterium]
MRVLTAAAMREVDRSAIEGLGLPGLVLMENAALGVVDAIGEAEGAIGGATSAAIFCGPGNNGGDGLAIARHLAVRGWEVRVFLVLGKSGPSGDAGVQLAVCRRMGLEIEEVRDSAGVRAALDAARDLDLAVDALFGTGLGRALEGVFAEIVDGMNELPVPRVAVDLPSGLDASRHQPLGPCVQADLTVTFAAPKVAHVLPPAAEAVGELVIADLGIPPSLIDEVEEPAGRLHLLVGEELAGLLPPRERSGHKGSYGHALLVAGAPGKAGAAILSARGAVRAGAGLVTIGVPEPILQTVDLGSIESMTLGLPAGSSGLISAEAVERVLDAARGKAVLALGPGLGQEPETAEAIRRIVREAPLPVVADADAVNAFAGRAGDLKARSDATVLTPHPGELSRLLGIQTSEIQDDRVAAARRAAAETGAIVVLKGSLTLIAAPDGDVWINPTGNPGMATGGSGDVLTGLVAGLIAQREAFALDVIDAVKLAVCLHGLAGDLAAARMGEQALAAGDLLDFLPAAFAELAESDGSAGSV